jgi:hypothetical protein
MGLNMNREDIIRMAREAGFVYAGEDFQYLNIITERFATLVASAEREKHKWDIHSCSPTCNRYACVATREAVLAEREACAKACEDVYTGEESSCDWPTPEMCATAIRARGQA